MNRYTPNMTLSAQTRNSKQNKIHIRNYKTFRIFKAFESLSDSIGWRIAAFSINIQDYLLWHLTFCTIFGFQTIILAPDTPTEDSRNSDDNLVSKQVEPEYGLLGWRPGPGNLSQKRAPNLTSPTRNPTRFCLI